ncbi:acyltransferase [Actinomadura sp. J1-007]|uniref:acyltransferase family protein n=2 Tax=Actinomadura TaxID=1988 RepID=UPI001369754D|nr:acyltransferase [Actinomadura sp. J1-007]
MAWNACQLSAPTSHARHRRSGRARRRTGRPADAPAPAAGRRRRLDWLDALRGIAALVVVFEHSLDVLFPEVRRTASPWFDFGRYGVFVFFLVSGYIVPASLERRRSVREFWIGRMFRLYPPWALAGAIGLAAGAAGVAWAPPDGLAEHPARAAFAHLTMLQDLLGVPNVVNVFWTLSYEMVFYLLVTALFVAGVRGNGAGAGTSLGFAAGAAAIGFALPTGLVSGHWPGYTVVVGVAAMAGGLLAVMSRRAGLRRGGACTLAALALGLLVLNNRIGAMESLAIVGTMFAGAGVYAVQHRRVARGPAVAMLALASAVTLAAGVHGLLDGQRPERANPPSWGWVVALGAAWLTFLAGLALRDRRFPRALTWLGVISYSVYLLHPPIVQVIWRLSREPGHMVPVERAAWALLLLACVLVAAAVSHRYVELPMQGLGRRLTRSVRAAGASAPEPEPVPPPDSDRVPAGERLAAPAPSGAAVSP